MSATILNGGLMALTAIKDVGNLCAYLFVAYDVTINKPH